MLWKTPNAAAPAFIWDSSSMLKAEWIFLAEAGAGSGVAKHLSDACQGELAVDCLAADAAASLEIEGEFVDPAAVSAAMCRRLGLSLADAPGHPLADGCARLAQEVAQYHDRPLDAAWVEEWRDFFHRHLGGGRTQPTLSRERRRELADFLQWRREADERGDDAPLTRAGLAHLWFESIHPFPQGTGIIGRLVAQKTLARGLPNHRFTPLGLVLLRRRNEYHRMLDSACRDRDATQWLHWFAAAAIEAGRLVTARMTFALNRDRLVESLRDAVSGGELELLHELFRLGDAAFLPGVNPAQYAAQTGRAARAVAAGMANLAAAGALRRSNRGRVVRYHLALPPPDTARVEAEEVL